ncbi:MAG TPA: glycosyltransferase family 4 protein [Longimicrobiaceae bacterium]|nr:glycosyltransferase family 4 protein [Longimicrobiaceae bacterium]
MILPFDLGVCTPGEPERVLYLIADPTRMAGANRILLELVRNLPPERVSPRVVVTAEGRVVEAFRAHGIPCEVLEPGRAMSTFGGWLVSTSTATRLRIAIGELLPYTVRLWRLIRRHRIRIVHVNDGRGALLAAGAARLARVPVVGHLHGEFRFHGLARWITENVPTRIITVSDGARRTLSPSAQRKATTVYNGITAASLPTHPIPFLESLRARGVKTVCCLASLTPFKGYHHLIDALAVLNSRGWRERLALFCVGEFVPGHSGYHAWLARTIREHGIDNITFTGWLDRPFSFYRYADAAVLPSVSDEVLRFDGHPHRVVGSEGFPLTILEAMRFAVPVVATRVSGVPEQVEHGITGLLVEPGDPVGFADALEQLLERPEAARAMGRAGAERVERHFSTGRYVEGVLRVYAEVARSRGGGSSGR